MNASKLALVLLPLAMTASSAWAAPTKIKNIVLVHGAFADGSGWRPVADILRKDGYVVSIVQQPMTSLEDDVAATNRIIDRQDGPVVLVGHSYGGTIITEAGANDKVVNLVYVAGFMPDEGEVSGALNATMPPASNSIGASSDGFLFVDQAKYPVDFANDVPRAEAEFMALSQMPVAAKAFGTTIHAPAWRTKQSYAIVATHDRMINPDLERWMYKRGKSKVTELAGGHAIFAIQPAGVAKVIEQAANGQ